MAYKADTKIQNNFQKLVEIEKDINIDSLLKELNKYNKALNKFLDSLLDLSIQEIEAEEKIEENQEIKEKEFFIVESEIGPTQWLQLLAEVKNKINQVEKRITYFVLEEG